LINMKNKRITNIPGTPLRRLEEIKITIIFYRILIKVVYN